MAKASAEIETAKLLNEQLISDKLRQEIELNNRKLRDSELDSKKLKQEVSWKKHILPSLQIVSSFGTAVSLILITYQLGFNSKAFKNDKRTLDSLEISINNKNTLIENAGILGKISQMNLETTLKAAQDSISNHKSKIVRENDRLNLSNEGLKIQYGKLKSEQSIVVKQISTIQNDRQKAMLALTKVNHALDSLSDEIVFKEIASNVAAIRHLSTTQDPASLQLISILQSENKFKKRLIDSLTALVKYADQRKSNAWGTVNYILYFGTQNKFYQQQVMSQIANEAPLFDGTSKKINYYDILTSGFFDKKHVHDIEFLLITRLKENLTQMQRMAIVILIADVENSIVDDPLYKQDFDAYLTYLEACKECYHFNEKNVGDKADIMNCLLVMCPQITIARSILDNRNYVKDQSFKRYLKDTTQKFYPTFSNNNQILNPVIKSRGQLIDRTITLEKKYGKAGEHFYDLSSENMRKINFWNRWFFDNKPLDLATFKQKIISESM